MLFAAAVRTLRGAFEPVMVLALGTGVIVLSGVLTPERALASPAEVVVALLSVVVTPLQSSALVEHVAEALFGKKARWLKVIHLLPT